MARWTRGYVAVDGDRAHARDAWPKRAVPASVLMTIVSLGVCLWGIGRAAQQSTLSLGIVAAGAVAGLVAGYLAIKAVTDRWLAGDRDDAFAWKAVLWSLGVAVPLAVLAIVPPTRPYAVAAVGAGVVGLMAGNLRAIRRAR